MYFKISISFLFLFWINISNSQTTSFTEKFKLSEPQLDKQIIGMMKSANVQGISIALVDSSGMIWEKGYGYKDVAAKIPVDKTTVFCMGSISKLFTAIAIMQLHEQGKININKAVNVYLPEFKPLGADYFLDSITIKSVLMHQSGLPSDNLAMFFTDKTFSSQKIIEYLNTHNVCTKPNTISSYSNIGFSLLGALVERVSGVAFNEYIKQNITLPLGMKNSSFESDNNIKQLLSKQYIKKNKEYVEPHISELMPAGGFYSNMEDMSLFVKMLLNKGSIDSVRILSENTFNQMVTVQNEDIQLDYDMKMGLPFFITMDGTWFKAGGSYSHGGNTLVFHSGLTVLPYQNLAIVISSNSLKGVTIVPNIERMVLDKALENKTIDTVFPKQVISKPQIKKYISDKDYKNLEGSYSFVMSPLKLKARKNSIVLKSSIFAFVLKPQPDTTFDVKVRILGISFKNKDISKMWFDVVDNDTIIVATSWGRNFYFANKIKKSTPVDMEKWKYIEGSYTRIDSSEIFKNVKIKMHDDYFHFNSSKYFFNKTSISAQPYSKSTLKVCGFGRSTGDVIRFTENKGAVEFEYSGIIYRKIK